MLVKPFYTNMYLCVDSPLFHDTVLSDMSFVFLSDMMDADWWQAWK